MILPVIARLAIPRIISPVASAFAKRATVHRAPPPTNALPVSAEETIAAATKDGVHHVWTVMRPGLARLVTPRIILPAASVLQKRATAHRVPPPTNVLPVSAGEAIAAAAKGRAQDARTATMLEDARLVGPHIIRALLSALLRRLTARLASPRTNVLPVSAGEATAAAAKDGV